MVQCDIQENKKESGKINCKWYLQRLKVSSNNHFNNSFEKDFYLNKKKSSNDTIRVVRGTTATQGLHIPRVFLTSPTKSFQIQPTIKQVSFSFSYKNKIPFFFVFRKQQIIIVQVQLILNQQHH